MTGAAQGTGLGIARRAVAEGARVLLADVQEAKGRAAAEALGPAARFVRLDVASEADWVRRCAPPATPSAASTAS